MIIKEKQIETMPTDSRLKAGIKQEQDVAFYLRRAFKNRDDVMVFNDLRIIHDEEVAQIDHLIVTRLGFCLIESKSIKAEVNINKQGEWSRKYNGKITGFKSPIQQVGLQQKLLLALLTENIGQILDKMLGLVRQGVRGRRWESICAVSSDAVINRKYLPETLNERVVKSEFVADWVEKNMTHGEGFSAKMKKLTSTEPLFSDIELKSICDFLLGRHEPLVAAQPASPSKKSTEVATVVSEPSVVYTAVDRVEVKPEPKVEVEVEVEDKQQDKPSVSSMCCKGCQQSDKLTAMYGKYGYYTACECGTNTSMKTPCTQCKKQMKVSKAKTEYTANCACGHSVLIYSAA